jgi:hypothetical protein
MTFAEIIKRAQEANRPFTISSGVYNMPEKSFTSTGIYEPVFHQNVQEDVQEKSTFDNLYWLFGKDPFLQNFTKFLGEFATLAREHGFEGQTPEEALDFIRKKLEELPALRVKTIEGFLSKTDYPSISTI